MTDTPKTTPPTPGTSTSAATGATTPGAAPAGEGSSADRLKHKAQDAGAEASAAASRSARDLRGRAEAGLHDARERAAQQGENAKNTLADEVSQTAHALETAANEVDERSFQHQMFKSASDGLMQVSEQMHGKSVGDMVSSLADFGRRNPAAFLGGAALVGFALARFARASDRQAYGQSYPYRPRAGASARPTETPYERPTTATPYEPAPTTPGASAGGTGTVTTSTDKETL
jgi:ElaB/YqjD/DUF883 family membrane-anchored ribosome-binding protein